MENDNQTGKLDIFNKCEFWTKLHVYEIYQKHLVPTVT